VLDGRAGGGLQLNDSLTAIEVLVVDNDLEVELVIVKDALDGAEVEPQVIGVEDLELLDTLELLNVVRGNLGDLWSPKKRKREHAEGKTKPRPQVKGGGDGAKRKKHSGAGGYAAHGAGEAVAKKKRPITPKEKRLSAKEISEARKIKRKRHYSLEKVL